MSFDRVSYISNGKKSFPTYFCKTHPKIYLFYDNKHNKQYSHLHRPCSSKVHNYFNTLSSNTCHHLSKYNTLVWIYLAILFVYYQVRILFEIILISFYNFFIIHSSFSFVPLSNHSVETIQLLKLITLKQISQRPWYHLQMRLVCHLSRFRHQNQKIIDRPCRVPTEDSGKMG